MEENLGKSPQSSCPGEAEFVSGLSTVLVATVQEAKDRISQIEYVFCHQLYPHIQAKSKTLQKLYAEARGAAENDFRVKEKDLLYQIEMLRQEKQQLSDEISFIKMEKKEFDVIGLSPDEIRKLQEDFIVKVNSNARMTETIQELRDELRLEIKRMEEREESLCTARGDYARLTGLYKRDVGKLESELANQTKAVDSGMSLQNKLLEMLQSYAFTEVNKGPFENLDEKAHVLLTSVEDILKKAAVLQGKLKEKTHEIEMGREVQENFLKKFEQQAKEIKDYEQQSNKYEKEKRFFTTKLEGLQNDVTLLRKEIEKKKCGIEEGRKLQEHLIQEIDLFNKEKVKARQELENVAKEKQELLAKLGCSKQKPDKLQTIVHERSQASSEDMVLHSKLLQQIEAKDSQIMLEKNEKKEFQRRYKNLKSQYTFLCSKYGLTPENATGQHSAEDRNDLLRHDKSTLISAGPSARGAPCEATKVKDDELLEQGVQKPQRSNSISPSSRNFLQPKSAKGVKSCPPAGTKRPASYWRDTRSHKSRLGPDLHDDFLDTPLEKLNGELDNAKKDKARHSEKSAPKDLDFNDSDDETQDMNVDGKSERRQIPPPGPSTSNFKYVEPVRKKSARENLKGIECKQCKKFYDAVLPTDGKEANPDAQNLRCEHQDGVSRHRYRYAPPLTPEGFWNIGFESEM